MYSVGPHTVKEINGAINYIQKNLKYQAVIPHYAYGWAHQIHNDIDGLTSFFKCTIEITNTAHTVPDEECCNYHGEALAEMASVIVDDTYGLDVDKAISYDCDEVDPALRHLPPIYVFKMDHSHSISRKVEINGETFEITVTFERKYTKRE